MKRLMLFSVILSLFCGLCVPATAADTPKNLLILGDSIATGHSLPDYHSNGNPKSQYSWATLLAKHYEAKQVNLAVDGDTTTDLLAVIERAENRAAIASADAICISIGGNNFLHLMGELFQENTLFSIDAVEAAVAPMLQAASADLDRIFTVLKEKNSTAPILVQTLFEPFRYVTVPVAEGVTVADWMGGYIERYNILLKAKAAEHGVLCVDVYEAFRTQGQKSWVYISLESGTLTEALNVLPQANPHPTKDGHRGIYDAYVETAGERLAAALSAVEETVESTDEDILTSECEVTTSESTHEGGSAPAKAWLPWVAVPFAAAVAVGIGILFRKKTK